MRKIYPTMRIVALMLFLALGLVGCGIGEELSPTPLLPPPTLSGTATTAVSAATTAPETEATETAATAVAEGTATPTLAPTPTLMPTATPVTDPPIQPARAGQLPPITRDLVLLAQGSLRMWNHNNGQMETLYSSTATEERETPFTRLTGDITQYDVSADGNRITAVRLTNSEPVTATLSGSEEQISDEQTVHEVLFLDTVSRESWTLAPAVANLREVRIAPNQQHVAFIGSNLTGAPEMEVTRSGPPLSVYLVGTPDGEVRQIANCADYCYGLTWHPQSDLLTWTDREALWLYTLAGNEPQVLLANRSDSLESTRIYQAIDWAANGRFLLLWEQGYEGGARAVYDVPTQQLMPVPDTFVYAEPFPTEVRWMQDDRLLVLRSTISGQSRQAAIELWRVAPDAGELVQEEVYQPEGSVAIAGGIHLENGRFAYGLLHQTDPTRSGLYIQTSLAEQPTRLNGLIPAFVAPEITWLPDGSGAVVQQESYVFYASDVGSNLLEMSGVFGSQAHAFTWLAPGTVPR